MLLDLVRVRVFIVLLSVLGSSAEFISLRVSFRALWYSSIVSS